MVSCGGAETSTDETTDTTAAGDSATAEGDDEASAGEPCEGETKLKVEGSAFAMDEFEVKDYKVKRNPKSVKVTLANYDMMENPGNPTGDQVKITLRFDKRAPKDVEGAEAGPVVPGDYYYHAESEEEELSYFISEIITKDGKAYLMWSSGQENPATATITNITEDEICGELMVASGLEHEKYKQIIQGKFYFKGDKMEKVEEEATEEAEATE